MFLLRYVTKLNENVNTCCEFIFNLKEKYSKVYVSHEKSLE